MTRRAPTLKERRKWRAVRGARKVAVIAAVWRVGELVFSLLFFLVLRCFHLFVFVITSLLIFMIFLEGLRKQGEACLRGYVQYSDHSWKGGEMRKEA